jgi:sugar (pentulose or hexulose) kinase
MIPDLMNYYLTGIAVNEYTDATMSLMVDQDKKSWHKEMLQSLGIRQDFFCPIVMPGNILGNISPMVCKECEIPSVPVINVASHDTASAIAGVPLADENNEWAFISLGTWAIYGIETDKQYINQEVFNAGFANQGGCEGKTNFVNLFTGLWVIQQCYERWCKDAGEKIGWETVVIAAESAQGGKSFINLDALEFAQPNTNMPNEIQKYCAKNNQKIPEGMGEIARCVFESTVLKFKKCHLDVSNFTGKNVELLHVFGGGSKNKLLCQWTADALGVTVMAGPAETTSVGNLLLQLKAMGEIKSLAEGREIAWRSASTIRYNPENNEKWDAYYERYLSVIK